MPRTISISPDDMPDATLTVEDDGTYELSITGLIGLAERPRDPTKIERDAGVVSANPPTVRIKDPEQLDLLILRATEIGLPDGLLDNVEGIEGGIDREQCFLAQLTRVVRRCRIELDPPS